MPRFVRAIAPGGTFFFTLVTFRRRSIFADEAARGFLRQSIVEVRRRRPFVLDGFVLLPDHLHCVMSLPSGDTDFSTRWRKIKEGFTRSYLARGKTELPVTPGQGRKGSRGVWQPRFWEHTIRDQTDFARHMDYIHFNAVKHGHATCPHAWPWSTFGRWVRDGVDKQDWCCACEERHARRPDFSDLAVTAME